MEEKALQPLDTTDIASAEETMELWIQNQRSEQTKRAYRSDLMAFWTWAIAIYPHLTLATVGRKHIMGWRDHLHELKRKDATINRKLAALHMFFGEAVVAGIIEQNPADPHAVKRPKVPNESERVPLENQEMRRMLAQPDHTTIAGQRDYAILALLAYLGLRREEVADLTLGSMGSERGHVTVRVVGKGRKVRTLPMPPRVHEAITAYLMAAGRAESPAAEPLFVPTTNNAHGGDCSHALTTHAIWVIVKKYARMAEIDLERIKPHVFRHTAITNALDNGAPLRRVQYMAGHADPKTTMRYDGRRGDLDDSAVLKVDYTIERKTA